MKKLLLLLLLISMSASDLKGQSFDYISKVEQANPKDVNEYGCVVADTLFLVDGHRFVKGEKLRLGYGSNPRKDFQFIKISPNNWLMYAGGDIYEVCLGSVYANTEMQMKGFKLWGNKKLGKKWYIIIGGGDIVNYSCEIKEAIDFNEIRSEIITAKGKLNNDANSKGGISIADEIRKMKQLLDDGILSQEEFDAQKAKLLEK